MHRRLAICGGTTMVRFSVTLIRMGFVSLVALVALVALQSPVAFAATYYLDSKSGSDANDGLSPARAWRTLSKASTKIKNAGDDVLLRSGSVFENQQLRVSWGGTPNNLANVDCYKLDSRSNVVKCSVADRKPEINGTFEPACAASRRCLLDLAGAVPQKSQSGLVAVVSSYVAVRNLRLRDSAGNGLVVTSSEHKRLQHLIVEDVVTEHTARRAVLVGSHLSNGVVRRVHGSIFGLCAKYGYKACPSWSGGIVVYGSNAAMILVEDNLVHDGFGEGINCLRSSHVVMRGNRVGSLHSNAYYMDNCSNSIVENNIAWGDLANKWQSNRGFGGINVSTEEYKAATSRGAINNVIRNNLVTGLGHCIMSAQWPATVRAGLKVGYHAYGNTCVALLKRNLSINASVFNVDQILVQNNIFYSPSATEGSCRTMANARIRFASNLWDGERGHEECTGPGDVVGNPQLSASLDQFARFDSRNQPQPHHFALQAGSPAFRGGERLDSGRLIDLVEYRPIVELVTDDRCTLDSAPLAEDFHCVPRQTPPSLGAIDRLKYAPVAPEMVIEGG